MASVDFKVKYEEELKARKRAESERDTYAKLLGKKSATIAVDEVQEEQATLVLNESALNLNNIHFDQLKVLNLFFECKTHHFLFRIKTKWDLSQE